MSLKNILQTISYLRFALNPWIRYLADSLGDYQGINIYNREIPIVVSLSSTGQNPDDLVVSLYSIIMQTLKPDKIILWVHHDEFKTLNDLPYEITRFIKNGIEIRFVQDLGVYTGSYYVFNEYSNCIIVTAKDNVYYSKNWLKKLYFSYIAHSDDIQVNLAYKLLYNSRDELPLICTNKLISTECANFDVFPLGAGGVLYPPNCISKEVLRKDIFLDNAPTSDDSWFWIMAVVHNKKYRVADNHIKTLTLTNFINQFYAYANNIIQKRNNAQLNKLMKFYKQNIKTRLCSNNS